MNSIVYILDYPDIRRSQMFNCKFDNNGNLINYCLLDGELLETWEIGQLLGGN